MWFGFHSRAQPTGTKIDNGEEFLSIWNFCVEHCSFTVSVYRFSVVVHSPFQSIELHHTSHRGPRTADRELFPRKMRNSFNWFKSANFFLSLEHSRRERKKKPAPIHRTFEEVSLHSFADFNLKQWRIQRHAHDGSSGFFLAEHLAAGCVFQDKKSIGLSSEKSSLNQTKYFFQFAATSSILFRLRRSLFSQFSIQTHSTQTQTQTSNKN